MGKTGNYANIVRGLAPLFRHSEWPYSTLLFARNPKLLRQRYYAKEFAHTCTCNCIYMYVQLHVHVCANNSARRIGLAKQ